MLKRRRQYSARFKFQVALEAGMGLKTMSQLAAEHQIHPNQITKWKRRLLDEGAQVFEKGASGPDAAQDAAVSQLYEQIGRLKMELEWLKKKLPPSVDDKRMMIDIKAPELSIRRQCELIGLSRSSFYYQKATESALNLELMHLLDEAYTRHPFLGRPRLTHYLRSLGYKVNEKRVSRLMGLMDLCAIYPAPKTTQASKEHKIYPYLLRNIEITGPNQVWSADITYVPMHKGFMYLMAILDWYSRYVIAYRLSNSLDNYFCIEALNQALSTATPLIFNTDQGRQFTARNFTDRLEAAGPRISMDGRGRVFDNIFIERLWRTVKYEDIYLNVYDTVPELISGLSRYFSFYNHERQHQSLGYLAPAKVHFEQQLHVEDPP